MKPTFDRRRFEIYKEAYERELVRRGEAIDRLTGVITVYTIIGGIVAYFASELPQDWSSCWALGFGVSFATGGILAVIGFIYLAAHIFAGTGYKVLATPNSLDESLMQEAARHHDDTVMDLECARQLDLALLDQYRESATWNQLANNRRESHYTRILKLGTSAVIALLLATVPFVYDKHLRVQAPISVTVESPIKIMTDTPKENPSPAQTSQSQSQAPAESQSTTPPPVHFVLPETIMINESFGAKRPAPPPEDSGEK